MNEKPILTPPPFTPDLEFRMNKVLFALMEFFSFYFLLTINYVIDDHYQLLVISFIYIFYFYLFKNNIINSTYASSLFDSALISQLCGSTIRERIHVSPTWDTFWFLLSFNFYWRVLSFLHIFREGCDMWEISVFVSLKKISFNIFF